MALGFLIEIPEMTAEHGAAVIRELGLTLPDPALHKDEATGRWHYTEPDWSELAAIASGNGPASSQRLGFRRLSWEEGAWVRQAVLGAAA